MEQLSKSVGAVVPELVSWKWHVRERGGLARLDYTQNAINRTLVAPYSPRPAAGAPVSAPIDWDELDDRTLRPDRFTIRTVLSRIAERGDLFADVLRGGQRLLPLRMKNQCEISSQCGHIDRDEIAVQPRATLEVEVPPKEAPMTATLPRNSRHDVLLARLDELRTERLQTLSELTAPSSGDDADRATNVDGHVRLAMLDRRILALEEELSSDDDVRGGRREDPSR